MKRYLEILIIWLCLVLIFCSCNKNSHNEMKTEYHKQHFANLYNSGLVANDENNMFYLETKDNSQKLIKADLFGKDKKVIFEGACSHLNISDGDIYFISDDFLIYKIGKEENEKQRVSDIKASFILIYEERLYVIEQESGKLYTIDLSTMTHSVLSSDRIKQIYIYNNEIYYTSFNSNSNLFVNLKKMNFDGEDVCVLSEMLNNGADVFYVNENGIYILSNQYSTLSKLDLTLGVEIEIDSSFYVPPEGINQYQNYIIYFDRISGMLKYLDTDTNKISQKRKENIYAIYVVGNRLILYETNGNIEELKGGLS